ncbi:MAG: lysophospholipase [Rhodospirillaceae bacterium]|jgi:hypothetical protein|nr:lysophospholipase [Rhodospirillaceae bacterium]
MTIHLVKIAVGIESIDHLRDLQLERICRAKEEGVHDKLIHLTRNTPRRRNEVLQNGSIYWIIKGYIRVRQHIIDMEKVIGRNGQPRCALVLDPLLKKTILMPHKPIQGWRYMEEEAVPNDLTEDEIKSSLPSSMVEELRSLGLL